MDRNLNEHKIMTMVAHVILVHVTTPVYGHAVYVIIILGIFFKNLNFFPGLSPAVCEFFHSIWAEGTDVTNVNISYCGLPMLYDRKI